jgi:hypothetical protein
MKRILNDPLTHFLGLGLALFALFRFTVGSGGQERIVEIDAESLLTYLQYQSVAFDRPQFEAFVAQMSDRDLASLIDRVAREEILYREALERELDRDDYIIRSRLVQKLEFLAEGFQETATEPTPEEVETYFRDRRRDYDIEPRITFTHVFFDSAQRGREQALTLAEEKLQELNQDAVPYADAAGHGDRFPYFINYVERPPQLVASHLGTEMAEALFQIEASESRWRGPFESRYGFHLVLITAQTPSRSPDLAEIRDRVEADARTARLRARTEAAIQAILENYDVRISPELTDPARRRAAIEPGAAQDVDPQRDPGQAL